MSVAQLRLQAAEAFWAEAEARLAAHAATEQALRFQLSQLTATVKVCSRPQAAASSSAHGHFSIVVLLDSLRWACSAPGAVASCQLG